MVLPKGDYGWKIGSTKDTDVYHMQIIKKGVSFIVYRFRETDDYYIVVNDIDNVCKEIKDSNGVEYYRINNSEKRMVQYLAYTYKFGPEHYFYIDNIRINLLDD